jgi:hypothetical protein
MRLLSLGSTWIGLGVKIRREPREGVMRFTIARCMIATAVFGLNLSVIRAYALAETGGHDLDPCDSAFLILFPLQLGLWRYLSTEGVRRRFWLGFEAAGLVATLAFFALSISDLDLNNWYTGAASDLSYLCLPTRVDVMLTNEHSDWFLGIIYFLPELLAAGLGGVLAAIVFRVNVGRLSGSGM